MEAGVGMLVVETIAKIPLGERESGTARLEEAVEAYRAALQKFTRERVSGGGPGE